MGARGLKEVAQMVTGIVTGLVGLILALTVVYWVRSWLRTLPSERVSWTQPPWQRWLLDDGRARWWHRELSILIDTGVVFLFSVLLHLVWPGTFGWAFIIAFTAGALAVRGALALAPVGRFRI